MGLANRDISLEQALKIGATLSTALAKYGLLATVPIDRPDIEAALVVLYKEVNGCHMALAETNSYADENDSLRAEVVKLKQSISGLKTANTKLRKKLEQGVAKSTGSGK